MERCAFLIGGMKCGSTSLFRALAAHPQVAPSRPKETNFLSLDLAWLKGPGWFADRFRIDEGHRIALEGSPSHSRVQLWPHAPLRMARLDCEPRVVMLLRDPMRRIRSHVQHALAAPWGERVVGGDLSGAIATSDYATQLDAYADAIGRERIHVVTLDQLRADPSLHLAQIQSFLGLAPADLQLPEANAARKELWEARPYVRAAFTKPSHTRRRVLAAGCYHAKRVPGIRHLVFTRHQQLPLPPRWERDARRRLAPAMERLQDEWGVDVGAWGFTPPARPQRPAARCRTLAEQELLDAWAVARVH